jgi:hypothetical protein
LKRHRPKPASSTICVAQFDDYLADDGFTSITWLDIDNVDPDWQVVIRTC